MSLTLTERRRGYMKIAQEKAKETNIIRGMITFASKK